MLSNKALSAAGSRPLPEFVSSSSNRATTTGNTVTAPSNIQNGYLLVAVGFHTTNSQATMTPPTGFSVISNSSTVDNSFFIATKTASNESGNYSFTWSDSGNNTIAMLCYKNATRVNTVGSTARGGSTTSTASSITPTYAGTLVGAFFIETNTTVSTEPSGMTQRVAYSANSPSCYCYDLSNQAASSTGTKSVIWATSASTGATLFQVSNETNITPEFIASANTQNSVDGDSLIINKPTGTVQGDLMVAVMAASGNAVSWSGDTDWTEAADQNGSASYLRIAYKVAGASEGSTYTFTADKSGQRLSGCIITYRYASYDTIAGSFTTGANPLVLSSISPSASQSILIAAGARSAVSVTLGTPISMTARVTDNDGTSPSYIVCDQTVAKGPTGTRAMSTGSTTNVSGIMFAIKPTRSL